MYKFSIIIPTYNSPLVKVFLTIESVLSQSFKNYEIIIADDGSNEDNFHDIKGYLLKRNFINYSFLKNSKNEGIVKNMQNAYKNAKAEYIKGLGPGDLLFDEDTLLNLNKFLEIKNCNFVFGRLKSYYLENGIVKYHDFVAPSSNLVYKYENSQSALRNMILKENYISGSTMIFKKSFILDEKYNLEQNVKYCEDLVQVLVALNGEKIDFYDSNLIWYEYGSGISTNKKTNFKLQDDHINFFSHINIKYPNNRIVNKAYKNVMLNKVNNPIIRKYLKLLNNPQIVLFKIQKFLNRNNKIQSKDGNGFLVEGNVLSLL